MNNLDLLPHWREYEWLRRSCFQFNRDPMGLLEDKRAFHQMMQQGPFMGGSGAGFSLYYTGSSVGVWTGQGQLIFTPGSWTFTVTALATITMKACGPGGYGSYYRYPDAGEPDGLHKTATAIGGGGGGGAFNLGVGGVLYPRVTYTVNVTGPGTQAPTRLWSDSSVVFDLGGGIQGGGTGEHGGFAGNTNPANGGPGGTSPHGSTGGRGGTWNSSQGNSTAGSTGGTGGGGFGGPGNNGCSGAWPGQPGGSGESGGGAAGEAPTGCNGGDGGYGGGMVVGGQIWGRGGGGGGNGGSTEFDPNPTRKMPVYVYAATGGVLSFAYTGGTL